MRTVLLSTAAAVLIGIAGVASVQAKAPAPVPAGNTAAVPNNASVFQLADTNRLAHSMQYFRYAPAIVLMSQVNGSSVSQAGAAELAKLQAKYKDQGVLFYMINSTDSREAAAKEVAAKKFTVPVLMDDLQLVGEQLGVRREGEVFVLNPKQGFQVAYHGPVANTANAIDAVLSGAAVANPRVEVKAGKTIAFTSRDHAADYAKISYAKTVAPIIQAKCVSCHQKGGIGTFAMDSYERVKAFAPAMREAVMTRRMHHGAQTPMSASGRTTWRSPPTRARRWSTGSKRARRAARAKTS